ncbi:hypothetical protein [Aliirhizobium smilacinae]|uniref:Uncharacterized protein n=1 Tax=Aliirhizobium smilacinae TaxID=1395944 RepID=A0A5C4XF18_9HYPH|nr:hypothetical protein [Rhizobium smilacinae]TNM62066.1 hypothetical protein FHP24_18375 [Rhizobium smilacinae]
MMNIHDWLDAKISERRPKVVAMPGSSGDFEHSEQFVGEALALKLAALADGFSENELIDACDGDVVEFVMCRQNHLIHLEAADRH